ncbi:MAG: hypothetical protein DRH04_10675 [Deltaproteobacteria bacterium]|nr:MAG: hypothetical protein DRH04_10675 [Deltaproteobacteria bacterium]
MFEQPHHEAIFARAELVDAVMGPTDLEGQCGFLEYVSRHLGRGRLESFLEVCCGPGYYVHCMAARGVRAYGVESVPEMAAFAREKARRLSREVPDGPAAGGPGEGAPAPATIVEADLRNIVLPEAVDLAFCPGSKLRYLLRDEDVIEHFVSVATNLGRGGLYVLDLDHPAQLFDPSLRKPIRMEGKIGDVEVSIQWGTGHEKVDPVLQIVDLDVVMEIEKDGRKEIIRDSAPVRVFTHKEIQLLVKLSGVFEWVATFGDLNIGAPFESAAPDSRMVPVLRCSV